MSDSKLDMNHYILDANDEPQPVGVMEYIQWHSTIAEKDKTSYGFKLARTENDKGCVSTVFLGSNHYFGTCNEDESRPVLWETMLFCDDDELNNECERACTRAEAMEVHKKFCEKYLGVCE